MLPAVAGGKVVNFAQSWDDFKDDSLVETVLGFKNRKLLAFQEALAEFSKLFRQGRSSSIALTRDDTRAVVVNRQKSTVTVIRVRGTNGQDTAPGFG